MEIQRQIEEISFGLKRTRADGLFMKMSLNLLSGLVCVRGFMSKWESHSKQLLGLWHRATENPIVDNVLVEDLVCERTLQASARPRRKTAQVLFALPVPRYVSSANIVDFLREGLRSLLHCFLVECRLTNL